MRFFCVLMMVLSLGGAAAGQAAGSAPAGEAPAVATPSSVLQASLATLRETVNGLHVEKWKGPAAAREETQANLGSIRVDLESTLPPMLAAGDVAAGAGAGSVAGMLPVSENVGALYDVLLRVTERAKVSAPEQQSAALEQARSGLESARRRLGELLRGAAEAQEQQVAELQKALDARPVAAPVVAAPAPAVPCTPPKPKPKAKAKPKQ